MDNESVEWLEFAKTDLGVAKHKDNFDMYDRMMK